MEFRKAKTQNNRTRQHPIRTAGGSRFIAVKQTDAYDVPHIFIK